MGANHNCWIMFCYLAKVVSNVPKILKWEQITTLPIVLNLFLGCFQCSKDTKMGANHNRNRYTNWSLQVVSNVPKILKWEQITTESGQFICFRCCFQCSKDTKMGANHNQRAIVCLPALVVSNVPKILKWEQITTCCTTHKSQ